MDTIPAYIREKPLTEEQLQLSRNIMIRQIYQLGLAKKNEPLSEVITCDKCDMKYKCRSAFDLYNTDGDCLEDK